MVSARTDDVGEALAAVLAALEAQEALDESEEAVLSSREYEQRRRTCRRIFNEPCQHLLHATWTPSGVHPAGSSCE